MTLAFQDAPANQDPPPFYIQFLPLIVIGFLFYFILIRGPRREQQKRDDLLKSLKKNDRVVTIGGIIGTVANVSADGKEITLKVDDNSRIKFLRSSIQQVTNGNESEESAKKT